MGKFKIKVYKDKAKTEFLCDALCIWIDHIYCFYVEVVVGDESEIISKNIRKVDFERVDYIG